MSLKAKSAGKKATATRIRGYFLACRSVNTQKKSTPREETCLKPRRLCRAPPVLPTLVRRDLDEYRPYSACPLVQMTASEGP